MSLIPKRSRMLAGLVWPGREVDGYANLIATRLRKLAAAGSTGMLPVSGFGEGAVILRDGQVVHAESSRTSPRRAVDRAVDLAAFGLALAQASPAPAGETTFQAAAPSSQAAAPSIDRVAGQLALAEPTIDAVTELLSSKSRYAKFRHSDVPASAAPYPITMGALLAEVERRHRVLRQLAAVITPDTPVIRNASLAGPRLQVSPPQWALVVGTGDGMTPRAVAMKLGRSVFATTIEVYRLIELGLLAAAGHAPAPTGRQGRVLAFMSAVHNEGGTNG